MITVLYNIAQLLLLAIFWPFILALVIGKEKYRKRIPHRLGWQLPEKLSQSAYHQRTGTTFWVHALSVGEVTSAVPLVLKIRENWPDSRIIVTATTSTGEAVARKHLTNTADAILGSPLDLIPVVQNYLHQIQPDIYIQVETDFWPNLLALLHKRSIPTLLVNGRISQKSLGSYKKFAFFFAPMFQSFSYLAMQTKADANNMRDFGVSDAQLLTLGNLKLDLPAAQPDEHFASLLPMDRVIFVAGSTHEGEEEILFNSYRDLLENHPELYLVLVPRNPKRAEQLLELAATYGLRGTLRSNSPQDCSDLLIVDTIGELVECYRHCSIAFVGGSLVAQGGHNPIEPAVMGVPVLYGPHMEDFQEIADDLEASGGGQQLSGSERLSSLIADYVANPDRRKAAGSAARDCIFSRQGVIDRHIALIRSLL